VREKEEGREGRGRGKGRAGSALPQIKIYDYTPGRDILVARSLSRRQGDA